MTPPDRTPRPSSLLAELTRLHDTLAETDNEESAIPLLQDIVEPAAPTQSDQQLVRSLLLQDAEHLVHEVLDDFAPQITAALEKRLLQHLEKLIREQEQLRLSPSTSNRRQP